jgi:CubicO group peptidase (beta-lactamase class C family)
MQKNRVAKDVVIISSPVGAGNWGYGFGEWVMDDVNSEKRPGAVTSPGLFGRFPWADNKKQYAVFLKAFSLTCKGRNEKYRHMKKIVEEALKDK